jgi:predicted DNA-binding protein with PD1-like motif
MNRSRLCLAFVAVLTVVIASGAMGQAPAPTGAPSPDVYTRLPPVQSGLAPKMRVTEATATAHVFDVAFTTGDEILSGLTDVAKKHNITSGHITGLGGLSGALLVFGDDNGFKRIPVDEKCELVSLVGHIQSRDGVPSVHLHAVVSFRDGSTKAGHVVEARVAPLAEISLVATSIGGAH